MDLALTNLQGLICHKTQQTKSNQTKPNQKFYLFIFLFTIYHFYELINVMVDCIYYFIFKFGRAACFSVNS